MNKSLFRDITYGMYIVTTKDQKNTNVGCVINTLTQITSEEPTIAISLNHQNYTNQAIKETKKFAISILSEQTKKDVIGTFGYHTSKTLNKFNNHNYEEINNLPIIKENICGYLTCELITHLDCGTHDLIIAKVLDATKETTLPPMTYQYYHTNLKGTSPKNAPTYLTDEPTSNSSPSSSKYRCQLCGYIYDDTTEDIPFDSLPDDWICPLCGAPKNMFQKITE